MNQIKSACPSILNVKQPFSYMGYANASTPLSHQGLMG